MRTSLVLAILLLMSAACGPEAPMESTNPPPPVVEQPTVPAQPQTLCAIDCLGGVFAVAGAPVNCAVIAKDVATMLGLLEKSISTHAEACTAMSNVKLYVRPEAHSFAVGTNTGIGSMYVGKNVTVPQDLMGMGHEFLHALEDARGVYDPADPHKGWEAPTYSTYLTSAAALACSQAAADNVSKPTCQ